MTNDELFGIINPATREWKDGLFSVLMRDQANLSGDNPKFIVLDGDIDPMWIESLNTVFYSNIPFNGHMECEYLMAECVCFLFDRSWMTTKS